MDRQCVVSENPLIIQAQCRSLGELIIMRVKPDGIMHVDEKGGMLGMS